MSEVSDPIKRKNGLLNPLLTNFQDNYFVGTSFMLFPWSMSKVNNMRKDIQYLEDTIFDLCVLITKLEKKIENLKEVQKGS